MEKIESFKVDHTKLKPGIYTSRVDLVGESKVTTYDIRMTIPNSEPPIDVGGMHAIEHLGATYLRNSEIKDDVIYFGPMGCMTGCYLILKGSRTTKEISKYIVRMFEYISNYQGKIPGESPQECGNYRTLNLPLARFYARRYLLDTLLYLDDSRLVYPE